MALFERTTESQPKVLVWSKPSTWIEDVGRCIKPHLGPETMTTWRSSRAQLRQMYEDDPDWRSVLSSATKQDYDELKLGVTVALKQRAIRMHHCCRPVDPLVYRQEGLRRSSKSRRRSALLQTMADLGLTIDQRKKVLAAVRKKQTVPDPELGDCFCRGR